MTTVKEKALQLLTDEQVSSSKFEFIPYSEYVSIEFEKSKDVFIIDNRYYNLFNENNGYVALEVEQEGYKRLYVYNGFSIIPFEVIVMQFEISLISYMTDGKIPLIVHLNGNTQDYRRCNLAFAHRLKDPEELMGLSHLNQEVWFINK